MAIYHLSAKIIKRSDGKSAVAAAAYRSASSMVDERTAQVCKYTKKSGVSDSVILAPRSAPSFVFDRSKLWNEVERTEKRKDAQLAREVEVSIPRELPRSAMLELVKNWAQQNFVSAGMIADVNFHDLGSQNPHAHILLTMREITPEGFGQKVRSWNDKDLLKGWRESWADHANKALADNYSQVRIDHRSYRDQGKDQEPTVHLGSLASALEKSGQRTALGDVNKAVRARNEQRELMRAELESLKLIKSDPQPIVLNPYVDQSVLEFAEAKRMHDTCLAQHRKAAAVYEEPEKHLSDDDKRKLKRINALAAQVHRQERAVQSYLQMPWYRKVVAVFRDHVPVPPARSLRELEREYYSARGEAVASIKEQARIAREMTRAEVLALRAKYPELRPPAAATSQIEASPRPPESLSPALGIQKSDERAPELRSSPVSDAASEPPRDDEEPSSGWRP